MAKKKNNDQFQTEMPQGNVYVTPIEEVMPTSMVSYAEAVILDRALPRVEDGLKPVQRRILYTMHEMGLTPDKPHKKSARIVGDCMGKYHPHGDSSVYDAMVRLAQPFNMRLTLVNGHGNFGSIDGDSAAAMRYTEARLEPLALELLRDMEKETVPFSFNFDDSLLEPDLLPGRFPNLLVNGASGIAVGLATNIPTHNLGEVVDGVCAYIDNPRISLDEMMKYIPGPDFSSGGYIITNELRQAYETGKGKITLRAKYAVENADYGKKNIVITELPYQTNKAELLRKIITLKEDKKELLSGIADVVDESDRTGMRAVVTCKKDSDVDQIIANLLKYTDLECTFGINMVAIAGGKPQLLGLLDVIKYYVAYQRQVILRRSKYELKEAQARCHIVEGLIIGVHNVDEVIKIIKASENTGDARRKLMERFALTERQAQAILDLRLARLAKLEITKLEQELEELKIRIADLQSIIASKDRQMTIIKRDLREIKKKYPCERQSIIVEKVDDIGVARSDVKRPVTDWAVAITANDRVKFVEKPEFSQKIKRAIPTGAKHDILYKKVIYCKSDAQLLIFTNLGNCVRVNLEQVDSQDFKASGLKLADLCTDVAKGEFAVALYVENDENLADKTLLFFTAQGMVKRTEFAEYTLNKPIYPAIKLKVGDEVVGVEQFVDDEMYTMCFVSQKGMCLNAIKEDVPTQGRVAGGVKGMALNDGDKVVFATQHSGEGEIIITAQGGAFKRVISSLFDPISRACKGVLITDKQTVVFADYVTLPYSLAVINDDKTVVEINSEDVSIENRTARGKVLKGMGITNPVQVVALKYKTEYPDGAMQIKF